MKTIEEIKNMLYKSQKKLSSVELKLLNCKCMMDMEYHVAHKMQILVEIKTLKWVLDESV